MPPASSKKKSSPRAKKPHASAPKKAASKSSAKKSASVSNPKKSISISSSLLAAPDASLSFTNYATLYINVTVQACIENGIVSKIGFSCENVALKNYLERVGEMLLNRSPDEIEGMQSHEVMDALSPPKEERLLVEYAFSAWQDVVSRLPTNDPLSGALKTIHFHNREFKHGSLLPDMED